MALECAPLFFGVSAIALPFLEFAAGARCLLLEVFPLVSDFVGLRFLLLEGDFSSGHALESNSPLRGDFSSGRRGFLRFGGIVPFHLLQRLLRAEV